MILGRKILEHGEPSRVIAVQRGHRLGHGREIRVRGDLEIIEAKVVVAALEGHPVRSNPECNDQTLHASGPFEDEITQLARDRDGSSDELVVPEPRKKMLPEGGIMVSPEVLERVVPRCDDAFGIAQAFGQGAEAIRCA